ncbi:hypothetical protein R3Q06_35125 [Rhodococcus erythropolis]|uniref:hypothetical protein n=1 Tax=Rhodococcus erythropolis TaxID=1833 RepID=UPI00294A6331|nr:hypothetical protein [Rhodococcus erythropolis]MDV6278621.1 hypothetical protein [Rhodococcus erythropolis]
MTFPQHWQAMIEHYDTMPEQAYVWAIQVKLEASQQNPNPIEVRPTPNPPAPERELADLDTTTFSTHWSPEAEHQLVSSRTVTQRGSRPEGSRL